MLGSPIQNLAALSRKGSKYALLVPTAGQSNTAGLGTDPSLNGGASIYPTNYSPDPKVKIYNGNAGAIEQYVPFVNSTGGTDYALWCYHWEFAYRFRKANPDKEIVFAMHAVGSTGLAQDGAAQDWNVNSSLDLYYRWNAKVQAAKAALIAQGYIVIMGPTLWGQGEEDCVTQAKADLYQTNLTDLVARTRADFGNTRFILTRMRNVLVGRPYVATVRAAQEAVAAADQNVDLVSMDDGDLVDTVHYTPPEYDRLGGKMWDEWDRYYLKGQWEGLHVVSDFKNDRYAKCTTFGDLTTMKSCLFGDIWSFTTTGTTTRFRTAKTSYLVNDLAANVARFSYENGRRQLRLDCALVANPVLWNSDLNNAAWVKTGVSVTTDQLGPRNAANSASRLTATADGGTCLQNITAVSAQRSTSAYVRRQSGSGAVSMTQDGSIYTPLSLTSLWTREKLPAATIVNPVVGFKIATSGDVIDTALVQNEVNNDISSPILTTGSASTRPTETMVPQAALLPYLTGTDGVIVVRGCKLTKSAPVIVGAAGGKSLIEKNAGGGAAAKNDTSTSILASPGSGGFSGDYGIASGFSAAGRKLCFNGGAVASDANPPPTRTQIYIGANSANNILTSIDSCLDGIGFGNVLPTDAKLQALASVAA